MSADPFNSQGGYTAGIPPVDVIDSNGNVITNVNTTGNVSANVVYATYYRYANGQPFTTSPAGLNTQVQYNDNGSLGASPNFTFTSSTNTLSISNFVATKSANLGNVANVKILGGINGYFLQTDGAGNLVWAAGGGGGGNTSPGGSNTQVQYNDNGTFGGDVDFVFDKNTNTLTVPTVNAVSHITAAGNIQSNGYFLGNGSLLTGVIANYANYTGQVVDNSQPNITSLGNLVSLNLDGNLSSLGGANFSGDILAGNITLTRNVTASNATFTSNVIANGNVRINSTGNLRSLGNVNFSGSANINLGTLSNIHISGGNSGYVLSTDGNSNLYWSLNEGNGVPGGSNTEVQYNSSGALAGSPFFTYDEATKTVTIAGDLVANTIQYGSGSFKFAKSNVYFATSVTTSNTALVSINANSVSSMDYTIVATNATTNSRQVSKVSAVMYDSMVNYNEYSTLFVNGLVGDFSVNYQPGNIITPAKVTLHVEPTYSSFTVYKIQMTIIEE